MTAITGEREAGELCCRPRIADVAVPNAPKPRISVLKSINGNRLRANEVGETQHHSVLRAFTTVPDFALPTDVLGMRLLFLK